MPDGEATAFPKFPSAFTEGEQERLFKLKEQRKEFEKAFRAGLTSQAFQELPAWQRIPRAAAGEAFTKFPFSLVTEQIPGIMGQLTPELARERKEELDLEIFELERKQRVVNRIPYIQAELTLLALLGEGVEDPAVLTSIFQDLGKDFTPEEEAWVTAFAARLAITTPEAILEGKVPGIGDTLPLSEADLAAWIKDRDIQPSQILTTVSLSQDIEDVSEALKAMFIPQEPEKKERLPTEMLEDFSRFFRNLAIEQGIIPKEEESDKELADRVKEEVGLREGWRDIVRVGTGTGAGLVQLEVMSDNSTFYDNGIGKEKIATYDPNTKEYHPLPEKALEDATDQISFSLITEEGEELDLVWKLSDSTVWLGQEQIGQIDEEGMFVSRELAWWEEVLGRIPEPILNGVFGTLDVLFAVPTFVGAGIGYLGSEFEKRSAMTDEEWKAYKEDLPIASFGDLGQFLPGGEQAQRYYAAPWWTQMVLSLPFWVGLGTAGITATRARAALATKSLGGRAAAVKAGQVPAGAAVTAPAVTATRAALAPLAGQEWLVGKVITYGLISSVRITLTTSAPLLNAAWKKSLSYNVFPRGSKEHIQLFGIWRSANSGQTETAVSSLSTAMRTNTKFKDGMLAWIRDAKWEDPEAATYAKLLIEASAATTHATKNTAVAVSNVVRNVTEQNTPVSAITVTLVNSLKPKGAILGKPKSLTSILEDMGYSNGAIKEMSASEAWATMLSGKTTPQERILPPTPEQENLKLIQDEIAVTENSITMMQERIKQMVAAKAVSTDILQLKLSVSELQGRLTALREEESIELGRGTRLVPPPQAIDKLQIDLENINTEIESLQTVIPIHEEAVATMKAAGETTQTVMERAKLNELEMQLTMLGEQKGQLTRLISKLEGPAVIKPVVPGHATTLDPNLPIQAASELAVSKGLLSLTEYSTKTADKRAAYVSRYNDLLKQEEAALEDSDEAAYVKVTKEIRQIEKFSKPDQLNGEYQRYAQLGKIIPEMKSLIPKAIVKEAPVLEHRGVDPQGRRIGDKLGVRFEGIQEAFEDIPATMLFTDIKTGSTFAGRSLDEATNKLAAMRDKFAEPPAEGTSPPLPPKTPPPVAGALEPGEPPRFPETDEGLARIPSIYEEILTAQDVLRDNSAIAKTIHPLREDIRTKAFKDAEELWNAADGELRTGLAKIANLREPKRVKSKMDWGDLPESDKVELAFQTIPDDSLKVKSFWYQIEDFITLFDARYEFQMYQEAFGDMLPFFTVYQRIDLVSKGVIEGKLREIEKRIGTDPTYLDIRNDEKALARVEKLILSENPDYGITKPTEAERLTWQESELAFTLKNLLATYEPMARIGKFEKFYSPDIEVMHKNFPDVTDEQLPELQLAIDYYQNYNKAARAYFDGSPETRPILQVLKDEEWNRFVTYLRDRDWGLIKNGYTPWIAMPSIAKQLSKGVSTMPVPAERGGGRFMKKGVHFPSEMQSVLQRVYTYIRQMESYWQLRPEWDFLGHLTDKASPKLANPDLLKGIVLGFRDVVEGYPGESNLFLKIAARIRRTAAATVFNTYPYLPYRNLHQGAAFHYDRSYYMRAMFGERLPERMEVLSNILYNNLASEMKGIRYDWLWGGEKLLWQGFEAPEEAPKVIKGLAAAIEKATAPATAAARVIENIGMYPRSDDIIRLISYRGYALKAYHATQKFLKDGNINKWLKDSGAIHLRRTEQNYAKTLLVTPTKDFGIIGARDLPGHEAVVFWLARELDNSTHFVYARQERAAIEWGSVGRLVTELATFQRQYVQRTWLQFEKFQKADPNQPWAERKDAFRNVMYILIYGSLMSTWIGYSTGKRWRSPYNTFDIINWEVGGFALGVAQDFTDFTRNWMISMNPDTPEEDKKRAVANMITRLTFLGDVLVPLWKVMIDSTDAYITNYPADVRIDREILKTLREHLDENYTKEEIELAERTWSEKLQKALFGGEPPERDTYEETLKLLNDNEAQLGQMNADFKFYTIDQFGRTIQSQRKSAKNPTALPDDMFTEEFFFSPLVQEYFDYAKTYDEYIRTRTDERREFRQKEGVVFEAWILFWGKVDNTALETNEERAELRRTILAMADRHTIQGIDNKRVFPRLSSWRQMTEEEWLENIKELDK